MIRKAANGLELILTDDVKFSGRPLSQLVYSSQGSFDEQPVIIDLIDTGAVVCCLLLRSYKLLITALTIVVRTFGKSGDLEPSAMHLPLRTLIVGEFNSFQQFAIMKRSDRLFCIVTKNALVMW